MYLISFPHLYSKLSLNESFSFIRLLNVVKQLYDSSATADARADDSDGSIITMGDGNVDDESEDDSFADSIEERNDRDFKMSAQSIMNKIGDAVQVMAEEAEHTGKTAKKMYDLFVQEQETRNKHKKEETRDDGREDDDSFCSDEDDASYYQGSYDASYYQGSYSSQSEDSYEANVRTSRKSSKKVSSANKRGSTSSRRY